MKAWLIAVTLTILGTLAGCGGGGNGNSNANNLTQAQARQVGTTVSIDFCINNGIIGTGGIRLCPDRVEALIYWKIGASGLWLC